MRAVTLGVIVLLTAPGPSLPAGGPIVLAVTEGSEVWLSGETNLMNWQCHGVELAGALDLAADRGELEALLESLDAAARRAGDGPYRASLPASAPSLAPGMRLEVPVDSLDCGNRAMERDVRDTLRADEFPTIVFELDAVREALLFAAGPEEPVRYRLRVAGELELAGVTRRVELTGTGLRDGPERFRFYTSLPLAMSDFGLTPPVALFGLLRARDDLTVAVTLVLSDR